MAAQQRVKYYVLNKQMDYKRGFLQNMTCDDEGLHTCGGEGAWCVFFSRLFDAKEEDTIWHRMNLDVWGAQTDTPWKICFFASNDDFIMNESKKVPIEKLILQPNEFMSVEEKKQLFEPYLQFEVMDTREMLLHEVKGRYLWFMLEIYGGSKETTFGNMMMYFPKQSWMKYLPEIYDRSAFGDTFLERYLSIFQSLYDDLNRSMDEILVQLDAKATDGEVLEWLASWLGIENIGVWTQEQLRYLVCHASQFYKRRGTLEGIKDFISLYTGEEPYIAEQHNIESMADHEQMYTLMQNLYGTNPYVFTVLIQAACLPTGKEFSDLTKIIEDVKPAWMDFQMITLRPYILLDSYSYLGVNSVLGEYTPAELNGDSMVSFSTLDTIELK